VCAPGITAFILSQTDSGGECQQDGVRIFSTEGRASSTHSFARRGGCLREPRREQQRASFRLSGPDIPLRLHTAPTRHGRVARKGDTIAPATWRDHVQKTPPRPPTASGTQPRTIAQLRALGAFGTTEPIGARTSHLLVGDADSDRVRSSARTSSGSSSPPATRTRPSPAGVFGCL